HQCAHEQAEDQVDENENFSHGCHRRSPFGAPAHRLVSPSRDLLVRRSLLLFPPKWSGAEVWRAWPALSTSVWWAKAPTHAIMARPGKLCNRGGKILPHNPGDRGAAAPGR